MTPKYRFELAVASPLYWYLVTGCVLWLVTFFIPYDAPWVRILFSLYAILLIAFCLYWFVSDMKRRRKANLFYLLLLLYGVAYLVFVGGGMVYRLFT